MWYPGCDADYTPYTPPKNIKYTRYCKQCAVSEMCVDGPCWMCGGPLTTTKPSYWPPGGTSQSVMGGRTWMPNDEGDEA